MLFFSWGLRRRAPTGLVVEIMLSVRKSKAWSGVKFEIALEISWNKESEISVLLSLFIVSIIIPVCEKSN